MSFWLSGITAWLCVRDARIVFLFFFNKKKEFLSNESEGSSSQKYFKVAFLLKKKKDRQWSRVNGLPKKRKLEKSAATWNKSLAPVIGDRDRGGGVTLKIWQFVNRWGCPLHEDLRHEWASRRTSKVTLPRKRCFYRFWPWSTAATRPPRIKDFFSLSLFFLLFFLSASTNNRYFWWAVAQRCGLAFVKIVTSGGRRWRRMK